MDDTVWKIDTTVEKLIFREIQKPPDWDVDTIEQDDSELYGTYHGNRSYGDKVFELDRKTKYNPLDRPENDNGQHFRSWRDGGKGTQYAWYPHRIYYYKGGYYADYVNFL